MVICLERGADLHMARLMPLPLLSLASVKSRLFYLSGTGSPIKYSCPLNILGCSRCFLSCFLTKF